MVNNTRITILLQQFAQGEISPSDYKVLIAYFKLEGNDEEIYVAMDTLWKNTSEEENYSLEDQEQFYQKLTSRKEFKQNKSPQRLKLWYRYAAAAVVLVSLSIGLFYYMGALSVNRPDRFTAHDISPGGNKAVLTLADGRSIDLSDAINGKLADQAGIAVVKTKNGQLIYNISAGLGQNTNGALQYNTITTPRGGQYQVNLPDGTMVWLNAESSLRFPVKFNPNGRNVELKGEAYFEVAKLYKKEAKQQRLPFLVSAPGQQVEVLGTHFNINAYPNEKTGRTTLLEGSVKITANSGSKHNAYLKPGDQASLNSGRINVAAADLEETMAWKNGLFMFNGQDLESIMKQVERWYDVEVVFSDEQIKKEIFNGSTSRFKNISQLLEVLETTGSVHFKIEGRRVVAMQ